MFSRSAVMGTMSLILAVCLADSSSSQVLPINTGRQTPDSTAAFHRSLSDSTKQTVYAGVLAEVPELVTQYWGAPSDWAEICGLDAESLALTVSLDRTIRLPNRSAGFAEQYPEAGIVWLLEHQVIDGVCELPVDGSMCVDTATNITFGLSTIQSGQGDVVQVELWMRSKSRGCPGDPAPSGFSATFLVTLDREDGAWVAKDTRLLRIVT